MQVGATVAGRYHLVELLGAGGMGEVWRATDVVLRRTVAVKVLLPALHAEAEFSRRFLAEARAMAMVRHPGVVAIYDFGEIGGRIAFLVMEFVAGESLSHMLRRLDRLSPATTMDLVAQAAEALQAVHDRGIVHRDVKPGNLMVREGGAVALTDFGIAAGHGTTSLTTPGRILGTLSYLAPEQVQGEPATARSDVYALGLVAYECLTGQRPFTAEEPVAAALQRVQRPAPPLPDGIPLAVADIVARALATDPADRWQTAAEMAGAARQAIADCQTAAARAEAAEQAEADRRQPNAEMADASGQAVVEKKPVETPDEEPSDAVAPKPKRRRRLVMAAAVVVTVLIAGAVILWPGARDGLQFGSPADGGQSVAPISDLSGTGPLNATPSGLPPSGPSPAPGGTSGPGVVPGPTSTEGPPGRLTVTGPGNRTSTAGTAISPVNHTASGGTGPYSWSASGLPPGLSINSSSGAVSGTPSSAKDYTVTVTAADSSSPARTGSVSYLWTVNAAPSRTCSGTNGTDVTVPDAASSSSTITISGCPGNASSMARIEVHLRCGNRSGLTVTLGAPDATSYTLYSQDETGANLDQTFTWDLSAEVANGLWRLRVIDNWFDSDVAVIDSWTITLSAP